jgi:hypothetical protein
MIVTLRASPPNAPMFWRTQRSAARWSSSARPPDSFSAGWVRKPVTPSR